MWSRLRVVFPTAMVTSAPPPTSYIARWVTTARNRRPLNSVSYH